MEQENYSEYSSGNTQISELTVEVSDGVALKLIDFDPGAKKGEPIIIFVAGWISLISGWKGVLREITPKFRTLYLETREKKSSLVPEKKRVQYDIYRLRMDLAEVIEKIIPPGTPFVLAGSSLGATAIMEYCASGGRSPECAVLIGPNADFHFPKFLTPVIMLMHPSLYFIAKPIVKWYLRNFRLDKKNAAEQIRKYEGTLDAADPYKLKANAVALIDYSIWERLGNIETPCLIVGATTDTLHGTEKIRKMLRLLPRSEYIEMASNLETHSEKAGILLAEFVQKKQYKKIK